MATDNIVVSYKIFKISTSLFALSLISLLFKPVFNEAFHQILDFFIAVPIFISGAISFRGLYLGVRGSQYGLKNSSKRFFGIFGNFFYAAIILILIVAIITDIRKFLA